MGIEWFLFREKERDGQRRDKKVRSEIWDGRAKMWENENEGEEERYQFVEREKKGANKSCGIV